MNTSSHLYLWRAVCVILLTVLGCDGTLEMGGAGEEADLVAGVDQADMSGDGGEIIVGPVQGASTVLFSSYEGELTLDEGVSVELERDERVLGVVKARDLGEFLGTSRGVYALVEGAREEVVGGEIEGIAGLGAGAFVYVKGGEAYVYDGGDPTLLLGGVERRGEVKLLARSGDEVWLLTDEATWVVGLDALAGERLERLAALPEGVSALWGTTRASEVFYSMGAGEVFGLSRGEESVDVRRFEGMGGRGLEAAYPVREDRVLGVVDGELVEYVGERWWWRALGLETPDADLTQTLAISHHVHDPTRSATWVITRDEPALYRVESSWTLKAEVEATKLMSVTQLVAGEDGGLWLIKEEEGARVMSKWTHEALTPPPLLDAPEGPVTYEEHIRPVAEASCKGCHASGQGAAVVELLDYEDWSDPVWLDQLTSSVEQGRMPKEARAIPEFADLLRQWREGGLQER